MKDLLFIAWLTQRKGETLSESVTWLLRFQVWAVGMLVVLIMATGG